MVWLVACGSTLLAVENETPSTSADRSSVRIARTAMDSSWEIRLARSFPGASITTMIDKVACSKIIGSSTGTMWSRISGNAGARH